MKLAATKTNQLLLKQELEVAKMGHALLEQKKEILAIELVRLLRQATEIKIITKKLRSKAHAAFRRVLLKHGLSKIQELAAQVKYAHKIKIHARVIAGLKILEASAEIAPMAEQFPLAQSDSLFDDCMQAYLDLLANLLEYAVFENKVIEICYEFRRTQRRVNALEKVFIPEYKSSLSYINSVLDNKELEAIFITRMIKNQYSR